MRDVTEAGSAQRENSALGFLRELIAAEGGFIPFERFMREALYQERFGYYSLRVKTIGRGGDFATSSTLHGALGRAVAAWAQDRRALLQSSSPWHLIELGAGGGQLADEVLRGLGWWARRQVRYHIVERSDTLRREQQARLASRSMVAWHTEIGTALQAAAGQAIIFSNEFVDAFPCVRLESDGNGGWREVGVSWDETAHRLVERLIPWDGAADDTTSLVLAPGFVATLSAGRRVEWHREYAKWLHGWASLWSKGALLTIDYGDVLPGLYHRRPSGTLRAYHQQQRYTGPEIYDRPGGMDLTADVNFSDLLRWGGAAGMANAGLCTQTEFLRRWLPAGYARRHGNDPAARFLLDEDGAGGAFKVLEQRRG